jgi:hypothetical protein
VWHSMWMQRGFEQELYSLAEVAALANVRPKFIGRLCLSGALPSIKLGNKIRRVHRDAVVQLLREGLPPRGGPHD